MRGKPGAKEGLLWTLNRYNQLHLKVKYGTKGSVDFKISNRLDQVKPIDLNGGFDTNSGWIDSRHFEDIFLESPH